MIKKILLVGSFPQNDAIYTYARSFYSALQTLGYWVEIFNYKKKIMPGPLARINAIIINKQLIRATESFQPDLVFLIKAETIFPQTLDQIKKKHRPLMINFYPDNPFTLWNGNSNSNVLKSLPLYDCFLIWSHMLIPALQSAGGTNVQYFPFAFDRKIFNQTIALTDQEHDFYRSDVCFIGTWEPDREMWLSKLLEKMPELNLAIWGNEWSKHISPKSILHRALRGSALYESSMIKAFRASTINLNFIRKQNMTSHNMRTLEIPASSSFMLAQRTHEQASQLFLEDETIVCFETVDELVKKIEIFLKEDKLRKAIIEKAHEHVQSFTLEKKLALVLKTLESVRFI